MKVDVREWIILESMCNKVYGEFQFYRVGLADRCL